jgi:hypothetical protein
MGTTKKTKCSCGLSINKTRLKQHKKSKIHYQKSVLLKMSKSNLKFMYDHALINFLDRNKHIKYKKVPAEFWYFVPKEVVDAHNMYMQDKNTIYAGISYRKFMEGVFAK